MIVCTYPKCQKAFVAGAAWQAAQSGVIQPDAVALTHTPEEIAAERYPPVGMQPDGDIGRRERAAFVAGHACGWTRAVLSIERAKPFLPEREEILAVLEPFARKADALSLSGALGHIERAHLVAARDLVAHLRRAEEPTDDA